jgi:hypothetical protein
MNGLHGPAILGFCLFIGLHVGAFVWAAWTLDEHYRKPGCIHPRHKSKSPINDSRKSLLAERGACE